MICLKMGCIFNTLWDVNWEAVGLGAVAVGLGLAYLGLPPETVQGFVY